MLMARLVRKFNSEPCGRKNCRTAPDGRNGYATFGAPLSEVLSRDGTDVPLVVLNIFHFLLDCNALKCEGIFRVNGNSRTVETLRSLIDETGPNWRVSQLIHELSGPERSVDSYSVASLLKLYLREIPGGVVPMEISYLLVEAYSQFRSDPSTLFTQVTLLLGRLETANYALLQHLCHFLFQVWKHRSENKMSAEALGIVFGPNVFSFSPDRATIQDQGAANRIMSFLIERAEDLFQLNIDSFGWETDGFSVDVSKTTGKASTRAVENDFDDHSSDVVTPSHCTMFEDKAYAPLAYSGYIQYGDESCGSPSAMPYLSQVQKDGISFQLSMAIHACIEQHIFGGLQPVVHRQCRRNSACSVSCVPELESNTTNRYPGGRADSLPGEERDFSTTPNQNGPSLGSSSERAPRRYSNGATDSTKLLSELTQRLHFIRASIRDYERRFERERGRKPSASDKKADEKIRSLMLNLAEVRAAIKQMQSQSKSDTTEASVDLIEVCENKSQDESGETSPRVPVTAIRLPDPSVPLLKVKEVVSNLTAASGNSPLWLAKKDCPPNVSYPVQSGDIENIPAVDQSYRSPTSSEGQPGQQTLSGTRYNSFAQSSGTLRKSEQTLSETLAVLLHRLAEKRCSAKRPESLQLMTRKQIEDEKLDLQKALLYFEGLHGRPSGRQERLIMRPLYDRYRSVKRMLNQEPQSKKMDVKHIVSSEGDSNQVEEPLSSTTPAHVRNFTLDDPNYVWDRESQSKCSTLPHAWVLPKKPMSGELGNKKHMLYTETKSGSVGSLLHANAGYHNRPTRPLRNEVELTARSAGSQMEERQTLAQNAPSGEGDSDSLDVYATVDPTSVARTMDNDSCDRPGISGSVKPYSVPGHPNTGERQRKELESYATTLSSFSGPDSHAYTTSSKLDRDCGVSSSASGNIHSSRANLTSSGDENLTNWPLPKLKTELCSIRESKRQLQKILKEFEHAFEQSTGHKMERSDRSSMRNEYTRYKYLKSRLSALENELRNRDV